MFRPWLLASDAGQRALAIAAELDNLPLKVTTSFFLGQLRHARGDYSAAIKILDQVVAWLQGDLAFERLGMSAPPSIFVRTWLAFRSRRRSLAAPGKPFRSCGNARSPDPRLSDGPEVVRLAGSGPCYVVDLHGAGQPLHRHGAQ